MEDWITQSEAAKLRDLSVQVINNWVRRGHVRTTERYGKILVCRSDVLSYEPSKGGRPPKAKKEAKNRKTLKPSENKRKAL